MRRLLVDRLVDGPSMKVPPKRKGNTVQKGLPWSWCSEPLNESPSEKEGKWGDKLFHHVLSRPPQ